MQSNPSSTSSLVTGLRHISKLVTRATELSHLHYSGAELASLAKALGTRHNGHETELVGYQVKYLDPASFRIVAREVFVKAEYFFEAKNDSPVILDCGANIGLATLFFKRLYPKARIHSFEADPTTASVLKHNVEQNHLSDVTVSNLLLADHTGVEKFYIAADTAGSLRMSADASRLAKQGREICVPAARLSEYIDGPVDLLKLDVEGSEFAVMRDLVASGKVALVSKMIIEYHHKIGNEASHLGSFLATLEGAGYEYQLEAKFDPATKVGQCQDILIWTYRPSGLN
jgi:FkbM family methyltransferase